MKTPSRLSRWLPIALILALWLGAASSAHAQVAVGASESDLLGYWGGPTLKLKKPNGEVIYSYDNGTRVYLYNGVITEIVGDDPTAAPPPPPPPKPKPVAPPATEKPTTPKPTAKPAPVAAPKVVPQPTTTLQDEYDEAYDEGYDVGYEMAQGFHPIALGLMAIGGLYMLVAGIWYRIVTFQAGILWGIAGLLTGISDLIFLFVHWQEAKKPFFHICIAWVILALSIGLGIGLS